MSLSGQPRMGVFGELGGGQGSPSPFCHVEVMVAASVAALFVLPGGLPQHGTEQRSDLGRHQDGGLQSVVWLFCRELSGGWERGGPRVPVSPP